MYYRLNVLLLDYKTKYPITVEIKISSDKQRVKIESENKINMYYMPICVKNGIKLEELILPLYGKIKNNKFLCMYSYLVDVMDMKKTNELFENYFLDVLCRYFVLGKNVDYFKDDIINDINNLYKNDILLEKYLLNLCSLPIKLKNLMYYDVSNINEKNIKELLLIDEKIFFNGQYFNGLLNLVKMKNIELEYKYYDDKKMLDGKDLFYNKKDINNLLKKSLLKIDYCKIVKKFVENIKLKNICQLLLNFWNGELEIFNIVLFVIGNDLTIKSENVYYSEVLNKSSDIINLKNFLDIDDFGLKDINSVNIFLNRYPKFKGLFLENNIKKVEFSMDYRKKNLDEKFRKILELNLDNDNKKYVINNCMGIMKKHFMMILNDINGIFSNEKIYTDITLRKYYKENIKNYEKFNRYNFFRNYFMNIKWKSILVDFKLINYINENSDILLFYGKPNSVIFGRYNFKNIGDIIKNKFNVINYLDKQSLIYDFLLYNQNDLGIILDNYVNLSKIQLRNLSKIIYTSKFVKKHNLTDNLYNFFVELCKKNSNVLIKNNKFNLRLKDINNIPELNYGILTRDIIKNKNSSKINDPYKELKKVKLQSIKYRKKYSKYKAKYFLEKNKNNKNYIKKNTKNYIKKNL